jgi:hypothetical protein
VPQSLPLTSDRNGVPIGFGAQGGDPGSTVSTKPAPSDDWTELLDRQSGDGTVPAVDLNPAVSAVEKHDQPD